MVHIGLVDLGVLEFNCIRKESAQATSPLYNPSNGYSEHQIVCFDVVLIRLRGLFQVFKMFRTLTPRECFSELAPGSFKVQRLVQDIVDHPDEYKFLLLFEVISITLFVLTRIEL
jgi:hypothetical protein